MENGYTVQRIGVVVVDADGFAIELEDEFRAGVIGITGFSHVQVLWWAHELDSEEYRAIVELPKPYKAGPDVLGVFATRSPLRPNPIAVTNTAVLAVDEQAGRIQVAFLDAEDGTPVLDIKPYHPATERIRDVRVPDWCAHWPQWMEESATFDWAAEFENARV